MLYVTDDHCAIIGLFSTVITKQLGNEVICDRILLSYKQSYNELILKVLGKPEALPSPLIPCFTNSISLKRNISQRNSGLLKHSEPCKLQKQLAW